MTSKPIICVVDDDASLCRAIKRLLHSAGYRVQTFVSGTEFLESKASDSAACLLLDIQMPGLDGFEVFERLEQAGPHLPVIFITAHTEEENRTRATSAGAAGFLLKPFDEEDLFDLLELNVNRKGDDCV